MADYYQNYVKQYSTIFNYIQLYSTIFNYIQQFSAIFNYIQLFWNILNYYENYVELYSTIFNYIQLYSTIFNYFQLYSTIFNYIQLYSTIFNYRTAPFRGRAPNKRQKSDGTNWLNAGVLASGVHSFTKVVTLRNILPQTVKMHWARQYLSLIYKLLYSFVWKQSHPSQSIWANNHPLNQ